MNNNVSQEGNIKPRIAVCVLHGVGQQAKFETLASFAAGFAEVAEVDAVCRTPIFIDDKLESAITVSLTDFEVDLVEYYYQPLMQRKVAMADVTRWLVETGFHIRRLYRDYNFGSLEPRGARQAKPAQKGKPQADGDFLKLHYMLYQQGNKIAVWLLWGLAWLLDRLENLRNVPLTSVVRWPLRQVVGRFIDPMLKEVAGDLVLYTAYDSKSALNSTRDEILSGCVNRIESLIRCEKGGVLRYQQVFVAGHSLGSVVAYDAVSRVALRVDHALETGSKNVRVLTLEEISRLGGLVTFGSPLDKVALMFWPRWKDKENADPASAKWHKRRTEFRQGLVAHFHGIRGLSDRLSLPSTVKQPSTGSLRDLPWLNVHHPDDLIAGQLDAFSGVENLQITPQITASFAARRTAKAHGSYWKHPAIYEWLIGKFRASGGSSDTPQEREAVGQARPV